MQELRKVMTAGIVYQTSVGIAGGGVGGGGGGGWEGGWGGGVNSAGCVHSAMHLQKCSKPQCSWGAK